MKETDDQRVVTVSVAKLKAYEEAVSARYAAMTVVERAYDAFEKAKANLERARHEETVAIDVELKATAALHGRDR